MSKLLRHYQQGNMYFITALTQDRKSILINYFGLLWQSINKYTDVLDFILIAYVILPDHLHLMINPKKGDPSAIMQKIKLSFSKKLKFERKGKHSKIRQRRFWDHVIGNDQDMKNHIDYIHYNPVKHGYVVSPYEWQYSSFRKYFNNGMYSKDWGMRNNIKFSGEYGE